MGRTFASSFLTAHILRPADLTVLERSVQALEYLRGLNIENLHTRPADYIQEQNLIVLAVKPQDSDELFPTLKPFLSTKHIILSIMAGVQIDTLESKLGIKKIIRAMPNLPAQIGMGMTAFTANEEVSRKELIEVQNLLSTTGKAIYFEQEKMLDAATAVSGSGPAYVFYFMSAMMKAATKLGFNESQAELLVWQTFSGSIDLQNKNSLTCDEWISKVASRGGTTEAAMKIFAEHGTDEIIGKALDAAFQRSLELGKKKKKKA